MEGTDLQDFMKAMETAKLLSAILNPPAEGREQTAPSAPSASTTATPFAPAGSAKTENTVTATSSKIESPPPLESLEGELETTGIRALKAAISYIEPQYQKELSVFAIFLELRRLLEVYGGSVIKHSEQGTDWRKGVLHSIMPYLSERKRLMAEVLIHCVEISELLDKL